VFFALNIDTPNRMQDLSKRTDIVRGILKSIDALPRGSGGRAVSLVEAPRFLQDATANSVARPEVFHRPLHSLHHPAASTRFGGFLFARSKGR